MSNEFDIRLYFKEGWDFFAQNIANLVVATIVFIVVQVAAKFIPFASLLVAGPMAGGMFYVVLDARLGKTFNIMRVFDGFRLKLVPLVLVGILTSVFTIAGMMLFILPAFLVMGWYLFSYLFVIDRDMDFWPAMEASRKIGFKNHLHVFLMAIIISVLNVAGLLALGIGLLITIPLTLCVVFKAYEHLAGIQSATAGAAPGSSTATFAPPPPPPPPAP